MPPNKLAMLATLMLIFGTGISAAKGEGSGACCFPDGSCQEHRLRRCRAAVACGAAGCAGALPLICHADDDPPLPGRCVYR